ncbi:MAG: carboxypeptidase regulatory-like domain-containing protein [Desulfuromonas sp.]|nr:carboxypeptidase regulatory-like domain-containing protein [Desulfuromonas sp.]
MKKSVWFACRLLMFSLVALVLTQEFAFSDDTYGVAPGYSAWDGTPANRLQPEVSGQYAFDYGTEGGVPFNLPWAFPFYGVNYTQLTANLDGTISLGGQPVIAAFNDDLASYYWGGVFVENQGDRVVVEWKTESLIDAGTGRVNQVAVVLFPDGRLRFDYGYLDPAARLELSGAGIDPHDGVNGIILPEPWLQTGQSLYLLALTGDDDNDGLPNGEEIALGYDPLDADIDDDGILDGQDVYPTVAATITLSPDSISSSEKRVVELTAASFVPPGGAIFVEQLLDLNSNGQADAGEPSIRSFAVTDGVVSDNANVPGDIDGVADGVINVKLLYTNPLDMLHAPANYLFVLSDGAQTAVAALTVTPVSQLQTVTGTVLASGNPVAGAWVKVLDPWQHEVQFAVTDTAGQYLLNLAASGNYSLLPMAAGYVTSVDSPTTVTVGAGASLTGIDLTLTTGTYHLAGQVYDNATTEGVGSPWVSANNATHAGLAMTDVAGNFDLLLPSGTYTVTPLLKAPLGASALGYLGSGAPPLAVALTGDLAGAGLPLSPGGTIITGQVTDSAAAPVGGLMLQAQPAGTGTARSYAVTDEAGRYTLALTDEIPWEIVFESDSSLHFSVLGSRLTVDPATSPLDGRDLTAQPSDAWIAGTVRDYQGLPLADIEVRGWTADDTWYSHGITAVDGSYRLPARGGLDWTVDALTENNGQPAVNSQSTTPTSGQTVALDFTAPTPPPCVSPGVLTVPTTDADGVYTVSWGASTTAGVIYVLEEAVDPTFITELRTAYTGSALSTPISDRLQNVTYYYRVKATKAGLLDSDWRTASAGCAVPGTVANTRPTSLTVPVSDADGAYLMSWGNSSTAGVTYVLEEATTPWFYAGLRVAYSGGALSTNITGRTQNNTYYYRVKAIKAGNKDSAWRVMENGCAIPGTLTVAAPTSITVPTNDADGAFTVGWGASATAGVAYFLQEAIDSTFTTGLRSAYYGTALSKAITGRVTGTTYYYRVQAMKEGRIDSTKLAAGNGCVIGP